MAARRAGFTARPLSCRSPAPQPVWWLRVWVMDPRLRVCRHIRGSQVSKPLTVTIPHQLGKAEALKRIEEGFGRIEQQLAGGTSAKVDKSWAGDTMNFSALAMGQTITGAVHVYDQEIKLDVVLPGILGMLAGKVRDRVQKEGTLLLEKKK